MSGDLTLRLYHYLLETRTEGPGKRAAVWVQGCPIHCKGCAVPQTWDADDGVEVKVTQIADLILGVAGLEGVTFAGGEPFAQAESLAALGRILKKQGLSIITFTGYTLEKLLTQRLTGYTDLLAVTDVLIDGPYKREQACLDWPLVGSANQKYHFLTQRYSRADSYWQKRQNKVEIRISPEGAMLVNGMFRPETINFQVLIKNNK